MRCVLVLMVVVFSLPCSAEEVLLVEDLHPGWMRCQDDKLILAGGSTSSYPFNLRVLDSSGSVVCALDTPYRWYDAMLFGERLHAVAVDDDGLRYGVWEGSDQVLGEVVLSTGAPIQRMRMVDRGEEFLVAGEVGENPKSGMPAHILLARMRKADGAILWSQKIHGHTRLLYAENEKPGHSIVVTHGFIEAEDQDRDLEYRSTRVDVRDDGATRTIVKSFTTPSDPEQSLLPATWIRGAAAYHGVARHQEDGLFLATADFDEGSIVFRRLPNRVQPPHMGPESVTSDGKRLFLSAVVDDYPTLVTASLSGEIESVRRFAPGLIEGLVQQGWSRRNPKYNSMVKEGRSFILVAAMDEMSLHMHGDQLYALTRLRKVDEKTQKESYATGLVKVSR